MNPLHFAKMLRRLREQRGWTQEQLAHELGISRQALFLLETGRGFPSIPLACRIAGLYRLTLDDLFTHRLANQGKEVAMFPQDFDPMSELDRIRRELDRMFSSSMGPMRRFPSGSEGFPAVNIRETDKNVLVEATLPGLTSKDVQINVTENKVSFKGERRSEQEVKEENFVRREYSYGSFSREVVLPTAVKAEEAQASLKNGLLTIKVPKKEASKERGRELTIREE